MIHNLWPIGPIMEDQHWNDVHQAHGIRTYVISSIDISDFTPVLIWTSRPLSWKSKVFILELKFYLKIIWWCFHHLEFLGNTLCCMRCKSSIKNSGIERKMIRINLIHFILKPTSSNLDRLIIWDLLLDLLSMKRFVGHKNNLDAWGH